MIKLIIINNSITDHDLDCEEHRNLYDEEDEYEEDQGDYDPYDDEQDNYDDF